MSADLDIEQPAVLLSYLYTSNRIPLSEQPLMRTLGGGVSSRVVLVERPNGEAWVVKQALPRLRVAAEWFSSPERIAREGLAIHWLTRLLPRGTITAPVFEDHRHWLLAMQAVPQPHENWKTCLLQGRLEQDLVVQFGRLLGMIHRNASERRDAIAAPFADRSFFDSLRLEPYYRFTAEQVPDAAEFYRSLIAETWITQLTLVHGDYSPKNILIHEHQLVLLDHEVVHFGDPAFDVGFALTHLLSKAHHVLSKRQAFAEAAVQFWVAYRQALGDTVWVDDLEERAVRHTVGCLLARVAGRSPLEYLEPAECSRQRAAALSMMTDVPVTITTLVDRFITKV